MRMADDDVVVLPRVIRLEKLEREGIESEDNPELNIGRS
jgi:hypothetical protein